MTLRTEQNHFAGVASQYAAFRPAYPTQLLVDLVALAGGDGITALDTGAGNGQVASALAPLVKRLYASDLAYSQISAMPPQPNALRYVSRAERSCLPDHHLDLLTCAQSLHWFDVPAFHAEAARIVKPGGVVAIWTYALPRGSAAVSAVIDAIYAATASHWPADRVHVDTKYAAFPFPYTPIAYTPPPMTAVFDLPRLVGYLGTWSGVQRAIKAGIPDPVAAHAAALAAAWAADPVTQQTITFDTTVFIGRTPTQI
jgi:ubiquinone/menaquinone biosynthesis C-methylase UbiE